MSAILASARKTATTGGSAPVGPGKTECAETCSGWRPFRLLTRAQPVPGYGQVRLVAAVTAGFRLQTNVPLGADLRTCPVTWAQRQLGWHGAGMLSAAKREEP